MDGLTGRSLPKLALEAAALGLAYVVMARLGIAFGSLLGNVSPIWPAAGVAIAWLTIRSIHLWPGVFLGTLVAVAMTGAPWSFVLSVSAGNALEAVGVAYLYGRLTARKPYAATGRLLVLVSVCLLSVLVCAVIGALAAHWSGLAGDQSWLASALVWSMGDLFGAFVLGVPAIQLHELRAAGRVTDSLARDRSWPVMLSLVATAVVAWIASEVAESLDQSLRFLPLIVGALTVLYGGLVSRTLVVIAIVAPPTYHLLLGPADAPLAVQISLLQVYNTFSALFCLVLGAVMDQTRAAEMAASRLASDLKLSNRRLEDFAYVAAHDLRAPLREIINWTRRLDELVGQPRTKSLDKALAVIERNSRKSLELIDAVLSLAKVQVVPRTLDRVDLNQVVQAVVETLEPQVRELSARIEVRKLPVVRGHASYLTLVFTNLLTNALRYTQAGRTPEIVIGASDERGFHKIHVRDNGVGVAPEDRERIFQIFVRGGEQGDAGSAKPAGTGIGLAFCEQIIQAHRGRIWVESTPGEGSAFYFTYPREAPESRHDQLHHDHR